MRAGNDEGRTVTAVGLRGLAQTVSLDCAKASGDGKPRTWHADNLAGVPREWLEAIAQEALAAHVQFGVDPSTRAQAAAHEAGHVLVAHALGERVDGARLIQRNACGRVVWEGSNRYTPMHGSGVTTARENPATVERCAVLNLAGFAGEEVAGLSHPSSAIDERFKARQMCAGVARVQEVPAELVMLRVGLYCARVLHRNRTAFDTIRGHLFRARRLTRIEAARMLAGVGVEVLL